MLKKVNLGGGKITFNHFQAFFGIYCCSKIADKDKLEIFEHGRDLIKERLNVNSLIKAFLDIEKLKYVLMTSEQLVLFEIIENPRINLNCFHENSKNIDTLAEYLLNKRNLVDYERSEIDKLFEKVVVNEDIISKKILLAHCESI